MQVSAMIRSSRAWLLAVMWTQVSLNSAVGERANPDHLLEFGTRLRGVAAA